MAGRLFVPPAVARELLEERQQFTQAVLKACYSDAICERWNRELKRLDPLLRMVRAPEYWVVGTPLEPGYYHLLRLNENAAPSVTPVRGPDGGFIEPPGNLLERLKSTDLWDVNVREMQKRARDAEERNLERRKLVAREERQEEIGERWAAVSRTQVSLNPDTPWTQNSAGKRKRGMRRRG